MKLYYIYPIILTICGYLYLDGVLNQQSIYLILISSILIHAIIHYWYPETKINNYVNLSEITIDVPYSGKIIYWFVNKNDSSNDYSNYNKNGIESIINNKVTLTLSDSDEYNEIKYRVLDDNENLSEIFSIKIK